MKKDLLVLLVLFFISFVSVNQTVSAEDDLVVGVPTEQEVTDELQDRLDFSAGLYIRNMYDMAAAEYAALIEKHPSHSKIDQAYYGLAESYFLARKYDLARDHYLDFLKLFPTHPKVDLARARLGESLFHTGEKERAYTELTQVQESPDPKASFTANYYAGRLQLEQKDWQAARDSFLKVKMHEDENPFLEFSNYYLGEIALELGDLNQAENFYNLLLEGGNEQLKQLAHFGLGKKRFKAGDHAGSHASFEAAYLSHADPKVSEEAFLNDLKVLHNLGNFENLKIKLEEHKELLTSKEKEIEANVLLGNAAVIAGDYQKAIEVYREVLADDEALPDQLEAAALGKIEALILSGDTSEALSSLNAVDVESIQAKDRFYYLEIEAYKANENWRASLEALKNLTNLYPDSTYAAQAMLNRGYLLLEDHNLAEARSAFYDFSEQFPEHAMRPKVHEDAIQVSIQMGDWSLAIEDAHYFLGHFPNHPHARAVHYQLAMLYSEQGEFERAHKLLIKHLKKYKDLEDEKDIHFRIGYNLQKALKWKQSLKYLKKVEGREENPELFFAAKERMAYAYVQMDEPEEAAPLYKDIILNYAENQLTPEVFFWVAEQLGRRAQPTEMFEVLQKFKEHPQFSDYDNNYKFFLSESYRLGQQCGSALAGYDEVASYENDYQIQASLGKGRCLAQLKRFEEAKVVLKGVLERSGADHEMAVETRIILAEVEEAQGNHLEAAKGYFAIAILYEDPERVPQALMKAGYQFKEAGRPVESAQAFSELVERFPEHALAAEAASQLHQIA